MLPPKKQPARLLLLLLTLWLTGCSGSGTINYQWRQFQQLGFWGYALTCLLALLVLGLIIFISYAEVRWDFLKLLNPSGWIDRIPVIGKYANQARLLQRGGRQAQQQKQMVSRYLPGQKGVTSETGRERQSQQILPFDTTKAKGKWDETKKGGQSWWQKLRGGREETPTAEETSPTDEPTTPTTLPAGQAPPPLTINYQLPTPVPAAPAPPEQPRLGRLSVPVADVYSFSELPSTLPTDLVGKRIGRYQIDAMLENSDYSTVYQTYDQKLNRPVRLHLLRTSMFENEEERPLFIRDLRERVSMGQMGLTQVYDYDIQPEYIFIITEMINGPDILAYLQYTWNGGRQVSFHRLLTLLGQVAEALAAAHQRGLRHGQLAPQHIRLALTAEMMDEEESDHQTIQPRVEDVGLGLLVSRAEEAAPQSWPYLAPELSKQGVMDGRTDVYSLGSILYHLTTGQPPHSPNTISDVLRQYVVRPTPPTELRPALPVIIEQIIERATELDPADRYQTAGEMAQALYSAADELRSFGDRPLSPREMQTGLPWIRITTYGEPPRLVQLTKDQLFMGNAADCDILLPGQAVAPHHAYMKLSSMGWQLVDLESNNGLFLEGIRLLPKVPELWDSQRDVRVGPYTLTRYDSGDLKAADLAWQPNVGRVGSAFAASRPTLRTAEAPTETGTAETSPASTALTISPTHTPILPAEQAIVQIGLVNQTVRVEHFRIEVSNLPPQWLTLSDDEIQLMPGATGYILLTIAPPVHSSIPAETYPFGVTAVPVGDPTDKLHAQGAIQILPFDKLAVDLHPERLRNSGTCQLTLRNAGNVPATITVVGRDPADAVGFLALPEPLSLPPGEAVQLPLSVASHKRPFVGASQLYPFDVVVDTISGQNFVKSGLLEVRPYVPVWVLSILGLMVMLLCIMGAFAFNYIDDQNQRATAEAALLLIPTPTLTPAPTFTPTIPPLPLTCADIRAQNSTTSTEEAVDGEYTIFLNRDAAQPLTIYCHNMAGNPVEYISLLAVGEGVNYGAVRYPAQARLTSYTKLRVDPRTLILDVADRTFATVAGDLPPTALINSVDYGTAVGCNEGVPGSVTAQANIDLTGLPLALGQEVSFSVSGLDVESTGATISLDRRVVQLSIGGRCGWVQPATPLRLVYIPPNPTE